MTKKGIIGIMFDVILNKCDSYEPKEVFGSIKIAVDRLGGLETFIKPGQKVLLKPNVLGGYDPNEAVTTHPEIIRAAARIVIEAGGFPAIGESPGFGSLSRYLAVTGIGRVSEEENIPVIELKTPKDVVFHEGKRFKNFTLASEIFQFDAIINLPKFKTHVLTGTTGAVKNLFGCVPGILKSQYHYKIKERGLFIQMIEDLARFVKPVLSIIDAVWAMEGKGGPSAGMPKHMGIIGVSADPFALDEAINKVISGINVQGFSFPDFKKIDLMPEKVYHLPFTFLQERLNNWLSEKPVIDPEICENCNVCVKVCASKALNPDKPMPKFDYEKCIRCFCCQEMCPERAIYIKRSRIGDLLSGVLSRF